MSALTHCTCFIRQQPRSQHVFTNQASVSSQSTLHGNNTPAPLTTAALRMPTAPVTSRFPVASPVPGQSQQQQQRYVVYTSQNSQTRPASPQNHVFPPAVSTSVPRQPPIVRVVSQPPSVHSNVVMLPVTSEQLRQSTSELGVRSVFGGSQPPPGM